MRAINLILRRIKMITPAAHAEGRERVFSASAVDELSMPLAPVRGSWRERGMLPDTTAFERHYRIGELAEMWGIGRETVRLLVKDEPGVIKIRLGRKKSHTVYSVPASVAARIHTRLLNPPTAVR